MKYLSDKNINRRNFVAKMMGAVAGATIGLPAVSHKSVAAPSFPKLSTQNPALDERFWNLVRNQFVLKPEKIYMNTGGLGPSPRTVIDKLIKTTMELEEISETGHKYVHEVNEKAAALLGASPDEIAITRNTTEGMNIIARGLPLKKGDEVIMSTHEHPGGAIPWLALQNDIGIRVKLFEPGKTQAENLDIIKKQISPKTKVLSISHIPCTTGLIFPVKEITALCRENNLFYVLDGAHPPGMIPVDLHDIGCDFYATSGHKWLMGPKGTGILYVRKEMHEHWRPTYVGAYSGEFKLNELLFEIKEEANATEYGTRNTPLILALGAAIDFINTIGIDNIAARGKAMADYFINKLREMPDLVEILTTDEEISRASIVTFYPKTMAYSDLQREISKEANIRLRGIHENNLNAIRCSFHVFNNFEEVDKLAITIKQLLS